MASMAREYITYARQLSSNGCFSKAVDLYIMAFEKNPQLKTLFEPEFRDNIIKLNESLAASNKIEDIFANFSRAITTYPGNIYMLNEIGKYLYKYGFYKEAWSQFQSALAGDTGFVDAEKNLNSVKNLMVERWHFRMLNDKTRNESYRAAIHEKVSTNKTSILDLGTGTGLFAMYSSERNPMSIIACDGSEVMTSLAESVLEDNRLLLTVTVINKMSTSMNYCDIGGKRTLLITELFDAGLFGEHILQSLSHAWENLLADKAEVIPRMAEFFVIGVQSDILKAKYKLLPRTKALLKVPNLNVHILMSDDTYDCEDVHFYKDIKYITKPQSIVKVDFTDVHDVQDKLSRTEPYAADVTAVDSGQIDAYIGFFNLHLTEKIMITTDPSEKNRANAWQQAVFFDCMTKSVQENDTFGVEFLMNFGKLTMKLDCSEIIRISPDTLRFLNDTHYLEVIKNCIGMACVYLGQMTEMADVNIVDLCPFPIFGLLMLKRGIHSLVCNAKTEHDKQFIEEVFKANDVELQRVTFLVGDDWSHDKFKDEKYHAIFCNILELCGDLDIRFKEIAEKLKNAHLVQGGLFMPSTITLVGQIVNSHWLDINNRVYDDNCGYKIGMHINKYQVSQNFCLDYTNLEYEPLSDPINLGNCFHLSSDVVNVPIKVDGEANAILCWYNIEVMDNLGEVTTNRAYSFVDGTAFLANPIVPMVKGNIANVLRCVDSNGSFKLMIDVEST